MQSFAPGPVRGLRVRLAPRPWFLLRGSAMVIFLDTFAEVWAICCCVGGCVCGCWLLFLVCWVHILIFDFNFYFYLYSIILSIELEYADDEEH